MHELLWRYRRLRDRVLRPDTTAQRIYDRATWALKRQLDRVRPQPHEVSSYALWREKNDPRDDELQALRQRTDVHGVPRVSVLMAAGRCTPRTFERSIRSLARQVHRDWELRIAHDAGLPASSLRRLRRLAARDRRIELVAAAAEDAWSAALRDADGDFVWPLVPGDELAPDAIARLIEALTADPQIDVLYSDEDELEASGRRANPFFKPDWSPDLLLSMNYIGGAFSARRALVETVARISTWPRRR